MIAYIILRDVYSGQVCQLKLKASKTIGVMFAGALLASCNGVFDSSAPKAEKPVPEKIVKMMKTKGMSLGSPIMLRIFKKENVLEVWKKDHRNKFALLNTYEICKWSGKAGPKIKEGDRQAPEGFYHVTPGLMNPNSSYHLSFNMGYPNKFDRANDRTGSFLMIHGACSSAGCYSMTDEYIEEIYALAREAFKGGQKSFQIQAFPFRLTPENLAENVNHKDFAFWTMLKEGADYFEVTKQAPLVEVCEKRYVFNRSAEEGETFSSREECPASTMPKSLATAFTIRQDKDQKRFNQLVKQLRLSPFVKPEDKPLTTKASIKARPTVGPLTLTVPPPPEPPKPEPAPDAETTIEETPLADAASPATQDQLQNQQAQTGTTAEGATAEGEILIPDANVPIPTPSGAEPTTPQSQTEQPGPARPSAGLAS